MPFVVLQDFFWFLVLIGVMILIHEFGHYWAARFFDVKVETFSFGFGPRLFGFKKGETDFRFAALLFGGYVKMAGEQPGDESASDPRSFLQKPRWQRMIIAFAGPAMNVLLAVVILTGLFMVRFPQIPTTPAPVVGYVLPDSPAAKAGIQEGDRIVQIENSVDPTWEDIAMKEAASAGHPLNLWITRNDQRKMVTVTPTLDPKTGIGFAGWGEESEIEIASELPGKPAAEAGLKAGDIIVSANGQPVRSTPKLREIVTSTAGKPVTLVYSRNGQKHHRGSDAHSVQRRRSGPLDDRRAAGTESRVRQAPVPRCVDGIGAPERQERHLHLRVSARRRGTAHVAQIRRWSHWHRADVGRSGARRPCGVPRLGIPC